MNSKLHSKQPVGNRSIFKALLDRVTKERSEKYFVNYVRLNDRARLIDSFNITVSSICPLNFQSTFSNCHCRVNLYFTRIFSFANVIFFFVKLLDAIQEKITRGI